LYHYSIRHYLIMKASVNKFIDKIDTLHEQIEMGLFTRSEAMFKIRVLRSDIIEAFGEGSDEHTQCLYSLIDCHSTIETL
jgi:hypothetical protein